MAVVVVDELWGRVDDDELLMIVDEDNYAGIADNDDVPGAAEADDGMAEEDEVAWKVEEDSTVLVFDNALPEILDECGASNVAGAVVLWWPYSNLECLGLALWLVQSCPQVHPKSKYMSTISSQKNPWYCKGSWWLEWQRECWLKYRSQLADAMDKNTWTLFPFISSFKYTKQTKEWEQCQHLWSHSNSWQPGTFSDLFEAIHT